MIVGFTGTRAGLTHGQDVVLWSWLSRLHAELGADTLHHGDCIGADLEAAKMARQIGYRVIAHPPDKPKLRAFHRSDEIRREAPYLVRDRAIVDACDLLIGAPDGNVERQQSGTWYTIRYARAVGRDRLVVGPGGSLLERHGLDDWYGPVVITEGVKS